MLNPVRDATGFAKEYAQRTGYSVALSMSGNHEPTNMLLVEQSPNSANLDCRSRRAIPRQGLAQLRPQC